MQNTHLHRCRIPTFINAEYPPSQLQNTYTHLLKCRIPTFHECRIPTFSNAEYSPSWMQNFYKYAKFEGDNVNGFYPSQNLLEIFWKGTSMQNLKYVAWTVPEISRAKVSWTAGLVDCRTICKVKQTMLELNDIQLMLYALPVKLCWTFSHTDFYRLYRQNLKNGRIFFKMAAILKIFDVHMRGP